MAEYPSQSEAWDIPPATKPEIFGKILGFVQDLVETALLVAAIYVLVNLTTARFVVDGPSMEPNFYHDEYVIVSRANYWFTEPQRGDVIVFHDPHGSGRNPLIKRIIGLPGEHIVIRDGVVYVNGVPLDEPYISAQPRYDGEWFLGEDQFFVMGDNRNNSRDSHDFGPIDRSLIIGRALVVYWPPQRWGLVQRPDYEPARESYPAPMWEDYYDAYTR